MSEQMSSAVTGDDRLWAALAYVFAPFVPFLILLQDDKNKRPFIKAHNIQALVWGLVFYSVVIGLFGVILGACLWLLGIFLELYWAYKAYQGELVTIPVITDFVKNQGWA